MREDVDTHRRDAELDNEVRIEERFDGHIARRRAPKEISESLDESLSVRPSGRHEQVQIFGRAGSSVKRQSVGPADQVAHFS